MSLAQAGVSSICLASQSSTATNNSNLLGLTGGYNGSDNVPHEIVDVWFQNGTSSASSTMSDAMVSKVFGAVSNIDHSASLNGWAITRAAAHASGHHWQCSSDNGAT